MAEAYKDLDPDTMPRSPGLIGDKKKEFLGTVNLPGFMFYLKMTKLPPSSQITVVKMQSY